MEREDGESFHMRVELKKSQRAPQIHFSVNEWLADCLAATIEIKLYINDICCHICSEYTHTHTLTHRQMSCDLKLWSSDVQYCDFIAFARVTCEVTKVKMTCNFTRLDIRKSHHRHIVLILGSMVETRKKMQKVGKGPK